MECGEKERTNHASPRTYLPLSVLFVHFGLIAHPESLLSALLDICLPPLYLWIFPLSTLCPVT